MTGRILTIKGQMRAGAAVIALFALTACDENGAFSLGNLGASGQADEPMETIATVSVGERDVEAPDIFQVSEAGLWDGRPSLGGVWVAHPDVTDPERVIIRNDSNGSFVIGALFRRERDNPGPALQVSSDAADELGILAGAPTALNVTALRREAAPEGELPTAVSDFENVPEITVGTLDPVDDVAMTVADVPATPVATSAPAPTPSSLNKPYIQVGIFSIESNATRNARTLRGNGLSTRILAQESRGKPFWRVIVGPSPTADDRAAVLSKVKSLGFTDAYAVTN